jgi:hypothetical protein
LDIGESNVDAISKTKSEIEQLIGLSGSDADAFWALSRKCAGLSVVPAVAAGAKWGPGLVAAGSVAVPGIGTVSGATATLLVMAGAGTLSYAACMSLLPGLLKLKEQLRSNPAMLSATRNEIHRLTRHQVASRA